MPSLKTEITEIVTGLGILQYDSLEDALAARAPEMLNVSEETWARLDQAHKSGIWESEIQSSWFNGKYFLTAKDGLRGRSPLKIEWKGPQNPPGYDFLPADLRIDHVYLISCKYLSKVLANLSPPHLFQRLMAERGQRDSNDWYLTVAEEPYRYLYQKVVEDLRQRDDLPQKVELPADMEKLSNCDREIIKLAYQRKWPQQLQSAYNRFASQVSENSAEIWRKKLSKSSEKELLLWRMLRLNSSPYFILGSSAKSTIRLRVGTPWDWRQNYKFKEFVISTSGNTSPQGTTQPRVSWQAVVVEKATGQPLEIKGHVEIRWSHGRFCGNPEAKLYLDSDHSQVPGYYQLG